MTQEQIDKAWKNARKVDGYNPEIIRKDACDAWIVYSQYGNHDSIFGWEVDHVYPVALGGKDDDFNLRAMQWENNRTKGDDYPSYNVAIQSDGNKNIQKVENYTVNNLLQEKIREHYIN